MKNIEQINKDLERTFI